MSRPPTIPSRRPAASGFTLLEILVVVVLIGILTSLLVIGIGHLLASSKRQQTRLTLTQLQAMYADWAAVSHPHFTPNTMPCPMNVTADLNFVPPPNPLPPALPTPIQVDDTTPANRYGAAVWFTRDLMFNMRSVPANAAALNKQAASALMTFPAEYNYKFPATYTAPAQYLSTTTYQPFDPAQMFSMQYRRVYLPDATGNNYTYYDCIQYCPGVASGPNLAAPPNPQYWLPAYPATTSAGIPSDDTVPVLLDAWGNPIIFVPGGTLGNGAALNNGAVTPGTGAMRSGSGTAGITTMAKSPDGHPFFASAGPGGDFSNGDDNLYSFEK